MFATYATHGANRNDNDDDECSVTLWTRGSTKDATYFFERCKDLRIFELCDVLPSPVEAMGMGIQTDGVLLLRARN